MNEGKLIADDAKLMRTHSIRTEIEQQAYKNIVLDFFILEDGFYINEGADKILSKIFDKSEKARLSAQKRWEKNAKAMRTHSEGNANGMLPINPPPSNPVTQDPIKDNSEFEKVWDMYGKKGNRKTSLERFNRMKASDKRLMSVHLPRYIKSTPNKQYRKGLEVYINQECWNDEIITNGKQSPHDLTNQNYQSGKF